MALRSLATKLRIPAALQRVGSRSATSLSDKQRIKRLNGTDPDIGLDLAASARVAKMYKGGLLLSAGGGFGAALFVFYRVFGPLAAHYDD